ncbi:MAG: MerC family mercury resistance protein [Pseudoxanthomonas sp.]|jgi:hypothetical protein
MKLPSSAHAVCDASAIGLSALCLAHCLLLPVLAALLPVFGAWAQAEWVHLLFACIALPLAGTALWRAHLLRPLPLPLVGLAGLGLAGLVFGAFGWPTHAWETPVTVTGSLLLAAAHVWNWRRRPHCAAD